MGLLRLTFSFTALRRHLHRETGQMLVLAVLGLVALIGFVALSVDVGYAFASRSEVQRGSDSAAVAAANVILFGGSESEAEAAALEFARENGFDDDDPETEVTVNIPPLSGPHAGDSGYVEVIIETEVTTFFAKVLGRDIWNVTARSVAVLDTFPKPYSIITLDPQVCQALEVDGNVKIVIVGAGTFTQSDCPDSAFHTQGSIIVDTADNDVVGGWTIGGSVNPSPSKALPIEDPLGDVPPPVPPAGPTRACPTYGGRPGTKVLEPGVYNCTIDPPGQWNITFQPGDYLITGGIIADGGGTFNFGAGIYTVRGRGVRITGNGDAFGNDIMFYVDEGQAILTGTGEVNLNAPSSGIYEGILVFQDRTNANTVVITGTAIGDGWGAVYAAAAEIDFSGNAKTSFQFISNTFYAHGNSNLEITFDDNFLADVPYVWIAE